ncbi:putative YccA/Bax inhibitor family protein [Kineococcus xinjiangensis]|uniref:Putative YccA/Bax inhibitor family protein n=1 Tax=Kineococcus xinjiangensis TaxID=512762 RepID=A0A2S6ISJ5_9ACTN|nr:Bax inhibitor-1/YccA family protein [Kineococcus xinjiangensis]PPK97222.1 putative YccA/Bax inhibitor family protein [Kineococcus xinjiangensis]
MQSKNPIFARNAQFSRNGYGNFDVGTPSADQLAGMYGAPPASPAQMGRMTLDDVVVRTASLFAVVVAAAGFAWLTGLGFVAAIGAGLIGFGLAMWAQLSRKVRPGVMFAYAGFEGIFVGAISHFYELRFPGIVGSAVLGTLCAFGAMLAAYKVGAIRVTPKFTKVLIIAGLGYMVFSLVNLGIWAVTGNSVYAGGGVLAIGLSLVGVVLASLFLVLDFDYIERGIRNGVPQREAWRAAFGLVVTLVWLYLEILRLLAILRGND